MKSLFQILLLLLVSISLHAIDIDVQSLEKIASEHPDALKERLILARYYLQKGNRLKAQMLVEDVLKKDPKNAQAIKLEQRIRELESILQTLRRAGLSQPIDLQKAQDRLKHYYEAQEYREYIDLYRALVASGLDLDDQYHIDAAYIYLWNGRYKPALDALDRLRHEENYDALKIRADICYYQGKYACAAKLFEKIYRAEGSIQSARKLIESYLQLGEAGKAERIYRYLSRAYPNHADIRKLGQKIDQKKRLRFEKLREAYEKSPDITTLEPYLNALFDAGRTDEALKLIHTFNQKNPTRDSLLMEAKYLSWYDRNEKALEILKSSKLKNDLEALLLLGKIESWQQHYDLAEKYLNTVLQKAKDPKLRYEARKALAFIQMWRGDEEKAKKSFEALQKERPDDSEVREALMRLHHDYKSLIKIYKHRPGAEAAKELGDLYMLEHRPKEAVRYWQIYLKEHPDDLETLKKIALAQIEGKNYYSGFGNLEYYTSKKGTSDAYLLLAKNYYWNGFFKEALDVLNDLLKRDPENEEALKLKGQILKVSPRYTTSNRGATTKMFWDDVTKKELFLADTLYFNGHYKAALDYYRSYLHLHPNDHEVRYRYAFALENAGLYGKAEGEFALAKWAKDSDELEYHYAYNLMKNGKLDEAEKILKRLKERVYRKISPQLQTFLKEWKKAWESLDFKKYRAFYAPSIARNEGWALHKQALFSHLKYVSVGIYDPIYKPLGEHRYLIRFFQVYSSDRHRDKGYKTLLVRCEKDMRECRIVKENWLRATFKKYAPLLPYIERALQELHRLRFQPQAMVTGKKKSVYPHEKPHKYHDLYLAPGLHKDLLSKREVFDTIVAKPEPVKKLGTVYAKNLGSGPPAASYCNRGEITSYHYHDSDDFSLDTIDLFYTRLHITEDIDWGVDGGLIRVAQKGLSHEGYRIGSTLHYDDFSFRLGINRFDDFTEWVPTLRYSFFYGLHRLNLEYTRQNALFYTYNMTPYDKRITADHLELSDYITFENRSTLWASLGFNRFSNGDFEITPQFDWIFYNPEPTEKKFHWDLALEGWYTAHSKPDHGDFYSPDFADSTLLRLDADYALTPFLKILGSVGAGYSFSDESTPYKYGLWFKGDSADNLHYSIGCLESNAARIAAGASGYHYTECDASIGYLW